MMTPERAKIVNALAAGPQTWTQLRIAYYGEYRAKSPASTSFNNQLQRMMTKGIIKKVTGGYAMAVCLHEHHEDGGPGDYGPECQPRLEDA